MMPSWTQEDGTTITDEFYPHADRYKFDNELLNNGEDFEQFDTRQDASYFGIWVSRKTLTIVEFTEGDHRTVKFGNEERYTGYLKGLNDAYGVAPPFAVGLDLNGTRTEYHAPRPE